jgi:hypothetical protein
LRKKWYSILDFKDHYENRRYTTAFMVYKWMDYWSFIDIFASYGHFIPNFIYVWIAINFQVSLFMGFNLICVCAFYSITIIRLQARASKRFRQSGLLT